MSRLKKNLQLVGFFAALAVIAAILIALYPTRVSQANNNANVGLFKRPVPNVDVNLTAAVTRLATGAQQAALNNFKTTYGSQATVRWDNFAGSPDMIMGFHTAPSSDTPENAARAFIES